MKDPLSTFDWTGLYERYDALCQRFDPTAVEVPNDVSSDRQLYYWLIDNAHMLLREDTASQLNWYKAALYWKLYSQPAAVSNLRNRWLLTVGDHTT